MTFSRALSLILSTLVLTYLAWIPGSNSLALPPTDDSPPGDEGRIHKDKSGSPHFEDDRPYPKAQSTSFAPDSSPLSDQFGYSLDPSGSINWIDGTAGTPVVFSGQDDSFYGPVDIGFDFKFYEGDFSELYINTNGTLNLGVGSAEFDNQVMPEDSPPETIIAPFWDDLVVGGEFNSGIVYSLEGGSLPNRYFLVQWHEVTRLGSGELLTFQVILFENGDILFNYLDLNGDLIQATVGIEDGDGVDGITVLHNAPGLTSGSVFRFIRPPQTRRVKFLRTFQSGLSDDQKFSQTIRLRNTGELGPDTFNLTWSVDAAFWTVNLQKEGQNLVDTNGDGQIDTGQIIQGDIYTITLNVEGTDDLDPGDQVGINLTATSANDSTKSATTHLETAVPSSFGQAFAGSQYGKRLNFFSSTYHHDIPLTDGFSGSSLALAPLPNDGFIYAWEQSDYNGNVFYSNIEYLIINHYGSVSLPIRILEDNAGASLQTTDRYPTLAADMGGHIGVIWIRDLFDLSTFKTNSNVYFAVLTMNGDLAVGPVNVTQNSDWRGDGDENIPTYTSPRIEATNNQSFALAWVDGRQRNGGEVGDIAFAVINTSGQVLLPPTPLTQSEVDGERYLDPALTLMPNDHFLLVYSALDQTAIQYSLERVKVNAAGQVITPPAAIPGGDGWRPDLVTLQTQDIGLAYANPVTHEIVYLILDGTGLGVKSGPVTLANPDGRPSDFVSITADNSDRAILTWMDSSWHERLYYALLSDQGTVLTSPLIFREGQTENPFILTSSAGQGNAPYEPYWRIHLPLAFH